MESATTTLKCPVTGCDWEYKSSFTAEEVNFKLIDRHINMDHTSQRQEPAISAAATKKISPPDIEAGVDPETWQSFVIRWRQYVRCSKLSNEMQSFHLFQCASKTLGDLLLKSDPNITDYHPDVVMRTMEKLAVIPISKGVQRAELMKMCQGNDELIRTFYSKVQGKAQICGFTVKFKCECEKISTVDYTGEVIKDVLLAGIADENIRERVYDVEDVEEKSVNEIVALIERKEKARKKHQSGVSAISSFKRSRNQASSSQGKKVQPQQQSPKIPCPKCKRPFRRFNGRNMKAFEICIDCFRGRSKSGPVVSNNAIANQTSDDEADAALVQDSAVSDVKLFGRQELSVSSNIAYSPKFLCNFTVRDHPMIDLRISQADKTKVVPVRAIADTGAQSNIWGIEGFLKAGFDTTILKRSNLNITAANKESLPITGSFLAHIEGDSANREVVSCKATIYVSPSVSGLFISFDTLISLQIVNNQFPIIGQSSKTDSAHHPEHIMRAVSLLECNREINSGCDKHICDCPRRSPVPKRPESLPFKPTPENIPRMKRWLLDYFGASTFNTCPHQPLQEMSGPPVEIHVDPDAQPRVCHTPAQIPLHWQEQVEEDIQRDVALGILEKVPYGEPVTWCHRMVITRKHNGKPRRTVDLSPLNKFCRRETHATESPFHLARRIPPNVWKSVCDAWNGYHSVPLRKCDRHLTTFITPFGRYRYTRAPQGYLSSGDGYNRRFSAILEGFKQHERCIDDTIFYDCSLEDHWWQTIEFLLKVGKSGIVLNPEKFQFSKEEVEFAGFKVLSQKVEPLPKYLNAIRMFPTPRTSTDIRSWFGLVNQLASYGQLRDMMEPFRPFLSSKVKFYWDHHLDKAFEVSKEAIVTAIQKGVQIFELDKPVCLRPDWSCKGIGYVLLQKHCECLATLPDCCPDGWKVVLAGSRFLSDTESRYAAVEGEALAIVYGLEQTRYFTQGCSNLLVVTDHKPLVKVFGDRTLDEITNTRLFRLKQRTLQWRFKIAYKPGKTNLAADATSRHPWGSPPLCHLSVGDVKEHITVAAISRDTAKITSLSWDTLALETQNDATLPELCMAIAEGFRGKYKGLSEFLRYQDSLYVQDNVVMYQDRAVIPKSLRPAVLDSLHAAHQGTSAMQMRAQAIVFWPGMTNDILEKRNQCQECNRNAPSQAATPSQPVDPPSSPFEHVFADFFDFGGRHYLVAGDRLSGFTEVFLTPSGTSSSGARGLIKCLRKWFATFGVPKELSSDGGPEFSADITREFFKSWGVSHRTSSAYHPQSNGRAEVSVKSAKRLLRANVGPMGTLDTDKFLRAMLQLRNTPDPDCGVSPAEIVFGRTLRDNMGFVDYLDRNQYSQRWQDAWAAKEEALRARFINSSEKLNRQARYLKPLAPSDRCFVQNQVGPYPKKWHHTGVVMEVLPHDKYAIKLDGSGRVTHRNRRFLKKYTPARLTIQEGRLNLPCTSGTEGSNPAPFVQLTNPVHQDQGEGKNISQLPKPQLVGPGQPIAGSGKLENQVESSGTGISTESGCHLPPSDGVIQPPRLEQSRQTRTPIRRRQSNRLPLALRRLLDFNAPGLKEIGAIGCSH